jgi:hypothetical protein
MKDGMIPLSDAAMRLAVTHKQAWDMLLKGTLKGGKRGSRWFVSTDSCERVRNQMQKAGDVERS